MKKIVITTDEAEFFRKLANPTLKIADWHILNDDMVQLEFENVEEFVPTNMQTNVILASFTTAHARLRLYDVLQHLGQSVLYFDTDSVIYKTDENQDTIKTGDYLGELTDELQGHHIVEFVSAGPKNYSFKLDNGETKCTIKGFTLNHEIGMALVESYKDATKQAYGYLVLDLTAHGDNTYRMRSRIFPGEDPWVYIPKNL